MAAAILTLDQQERFGDFSPGELETLIAEGEKSISSRGTLDGTQAFERRKARRHKR